MGRLVIFQKNDCGRRGQVQNIFENFSQQGTPPESFGMEIGWGIDSI